MDSHSFSFISEVDRGAKANFRWPCPVSRARLLAWGWEAGVGVRICSLCSDHVTDSPGHAGGLGSDGSVSCNLATPVIWAHSEHGP